MKEIKQETGRSMVEMLGVLAVIGVLSVGGISGYTLAMNKHRANSVVSDLMKRAVIVSSQRQLGQTANMNGFGKKVGEYPVENEVDTSESGKFKITVKDVPQPVCQRILSLSEQWKNASIQANCEQEKNNMTFIFNDDLSGASDENEVPQEPKECSNCESECGVCNTQTGECEKHDERCPLDKPYCGANGICTECANGYLDSSGTTPTCKLCSWGGSTIVPKNECYNCSDRFVNYKGQCMHCDRVEAAAHTLSKEDCFRCPNRIFIAGATVTGEAVPEGAAGGCYYCDPTYGEQSPNRDKCEMKQSQTCPEGEYFRLGTCGTCFSNDGQAATSRDYCLSCKGSRYYAGDGGRCVGQSEYTTETLRRNYEGVVKEDCLAMEGFPLFFYGEDENDGICEWCPTEIKEDANGEKVCADTCPTGTYLYLEHKQWGQNSCKPCPADTSGLTAEEQAQCNP